MISFNQRGHFITGMFTVYSRATNYTMVHTTSDKQISRTFQGFSRPKIYLINRQSLTPFDQLIG